MWRFISLICFSAVVAMGCEKTDPVPLKLSDYIQANEGASITPELIACAGGMPAGWMGDTDHPSSVFYYPITGAFNVRYWESKGLLSDSLDYSQYTEKQLSGEPVFNGKLWRFLNTPFDGERFGIVTYETNGKLHYCEPIRLKVHPKPTQVAPELITITTNGLTPYFEWQDGLIQENIIYFQVVSDMEGNIISGTYTYDKHWEFYNLSNVVLNVHDVSPTPQLQPGTTYRFTLMGVSDDNWVNLMGEKTFTTP